MICCELGWGFIGYMYIYIHTSWASWQNQNGSIDGAVRRCLLSFAEMSICTSQVGFHHQQCGKSPSMGNNFRMLQAIPSPSVGTQFLTMFKIQDVFNTYALPFGNVTMLWTWTNCPFMDDLPVKRSDFPSLSTFSEAYHDCALRNPKSEKPTLHHSQLL